ncbi:hypothetical protein [Streptomyces sp. NBC_01304]|uniref:hypothetical protein n=1 Tax=Streptomyces sp. NBC_01304 TaxID=2903818 RepID=UPI002E13E4A3|nr:hypothetical protein OG430_00070 [Streptomyces sp. NBC_01304]WSJ90883.1 hypothetical protein OG430_47440 [Streptomyces sp. NBC_01304]
MITSRIRSRRSWALVALPCALFLSFAAAPAVSADVPAGPVPLKTSLQKAVALLPVVEEILIAEATTEVTRARAAR